MSDYSKKKSSDSPKAKKTKASLVNHRYGIGLYPIMSYEATPVDNGFVIMKPDSECIQVEVGDVMPSVGEVGLDPNGNVTVGKYTVPVGLSLSKEFTAKPINKDKTEFALMDTKGRVREKYKLGDYTARGNLIEQDQYGNLKIGDSSIKVLPILAKTRLQILSEIPREEAKKFGLFSANRAVFNTFSGQDLSDGTPTFGYFIPRGKFTKGKKMGEFKEVVEGELVTTAEMYPAGSNPNIISLRVRRPDVAYEATTLFQEKIEIQNMIQGILDKETLKKSESKSGINISEKTLSRLNGRLDAINIKLNDIGKKWEFSELYSVSDGKEFLSKLKPNSPDRQREPS